MWGRIQERAPVCLCIYEPCGGRGRRGGQPPAAVAEPVEPRSGQAACPFPWPASWNLNSKSVHRLPGPAPLGAGATPCRVPISPACPEKGGSPPAHHPGLGLIPPPSLGPLDTGVGGGGGGEALKAGDCLGELGDRAPIVPAPEPPQWSSRAQRGFDNGQDISMQGQPLGPLPVPQPRGGRGRRGAAASLVGGGRGWGRAEAVEILAPKGSPGGTAQETGKETRPGPPNLPLVRALQVEKARGTGRRRGSAVGDQAPSSQAGLLKKHVGCLSPPTFWPQFSHLFKGTVWVGEAKPSNRDQGLKPQPAMSQSRQAACGS